MNTEVTDYIKKQKSPQKEILNKLRKILLKTLPKLKKAEQVKVGVPFYEGKYYLVGLKDSVNLGFSIKGLKKSEIKDFQGTGKTMRHLKFKSPDEINKKELTKLIKLVDRKAKCASCY